MDSIIEWYQGDMDHNRRRDEIINSSLYLIKEKFIKDEEYFICR